MTDADLLRTAAERAIRYRQSLPTARVTPTATGDQLRAALDGPVPEEPSEPGDVVLALADSLEAGGLMGMASGRFFGFVIGGSTPASVAADWLATAWDQNAGLFAPTPGVAVVEEVVGRWLLALLGLPSHCSFALVTGGQMANTTALAAARHHVLAQAGWDVEADGLTGAPPVRLLVGEEVHVTIPRAARFLGFGNRAIVRVPVDGNGGMRPDALASALAVGSPQPTIVCCQAGNVNTGALDPVGGLADVAHRHGAWLHVDGAIGLWSAVCTPSKLPGLERADSWSTDAHKWLNVPYDCGITFCAHPQSHRASMAVTAAYLVQSAPGGDRDPMDWTPEFSRRARGVSLYAALATLGRSGIAEVVERCCRHARRFAERLRTEPGVEVLNDVVLNQVLVRFLALGGGSADHDARTRAVIAAVQDDGTCWVGGSVWRGQAVMRISVSNYATNEVDVERSADAIVGALRSLDRAQ